MSLGHVKQSANFVPPYQASGVPYIATVASGATKTIGLQYVTSEITIAVSGTASSTVNFGLDNSADFTIPGDSDIVFTGYWKYGVEVPTASDHWYDLGTLIANASIAGREGTGYSISADGKTMTVTLVDGLRGGRLAVVAQLHHALADGIGAMQVLSSMYDSEPVAPEVPAPDYHPPDRAPGSASLLREAIAESLNRLAIKTPRFWMKNAAPLLSAIARGISDRDAPEQPEVQPTTTMCS